MSCIKSFKAKLILGFCLVFLLPVSVWTQSITGTISGVVTDSNGGVVPNATVTLINEQTATSRNLVTNEEGRFVFNSVQPGTYTIKIEKQGFQTLQRTNNALTASDNLALGELPLTAGNVAETVTVTSEGQVIEKESSNLTARLTSDQIALISTKGRDFTSLLRLIPGTSNNDDVEAVGEGFGTDLPNFSGQRGRSTVTTIDGLNASEPSGSNKVSLSINQDAVGEVQVLRNNYAAEYGNNGGALIQVVSKGGGKDFHGTAYYFIRNEALNATNFFTNKAGLPRPLYRHNIWGFNFGGPLWIPRFGESEQMFLKNKAFFLFSYEKPHTITPTDPVFVTVPTALERQGNFSQSLNASGQLITVLDPVTGTQFPGNIIPSQRFNASGLALLSFFPLPNTPGGRTTTGTPYNYVFQKSVDVPKRSMVIRFDVKPTTKDSMFWKAQWWTSDNQGLGTSGWPSGDANRWGILSHYLYKDNGWSANWVHVFNSKVVNEFNFGMRHDSEGFVPSTGVIEGLQRSALNYTAPQLFPANNSLGTIPRATGWSSVPGTPANINWLDRWGEIGNDYIQPSFADNLSYTIGAHRLKFGGYFERLKNSEARGGQWSGVFNFGSASSYSTSQGNTQYAYANALLGNFQSYSESSARPFTNLELKLFQWYAQDEWKFNRRLTFTYGMRWGYHSPFLQIDGQGSNFDPSLFNAANAPLLYLPACSIALAAPTSGGAAACPTANRRAFDPRNPSVLLTNTNLVGTFVPGTGSLTNGLAIGTDPNTPPGYRKTAPIDWEPRLGLAWDIFGDGKTALRMQGGVYHSPRIGGGTTGGNLVNNPPANRTFTVNFGNIDNLVNLVGTALNSPSSLNAVEVMSHTPTTYNWTVGVQRDLGFDTIIEVSYVGSVSRWLGERRNINQVPDNAHFIDLNGLPLNCDPKTNLSCTRNPFSNAQFNGTHVTGVLGDNFLRPYRGYGDINLVTWSGTSNYNGLQVQVNRRYAKGFEYGVAYTWSKTFDYANDDSSDVTLGRPYKAYNYGPADFDQTHVLTVNYIWDVPLFKHAKGFVHSALGGWQVSGTTSFATGKPKTFGSGTGLNWAYSGGTYTITAGQTYLNTNQPCAPGFALTPGSTTSCYWAGITDFTGGDNNARPVLLCDPNRRPGTTDASGTSFLIDTSCFAAPGTQGTIGNLGRNVIRLPSIFNTDIALFKNFRWGEKRSIQLRWETYNLFNRANFSDINGAMTFAANTSVTALALGNSTCPTGTSVVYQGSATVPYRCAASTLGQISQTTASFGTPRTARAPRVMQASIRINF